VELDGLGGRVGRGVYEGCLCYADGGEGGYAGDSAFEWAYCC
jgi:hypothetical protein